MVVLGIVAGLATTAEKNDDCIESSEQLDKCVRFDVLEDSTVGVKIAELLSLNVSTSIDEQFSLKVQKTAEVPQTQFIERVVNIPIMQQWQVQQFKLCRRSWRFTDAVPMVQMVQKTEEISHKRSSWTRLPRCPWWCSTRFPRFRWCRKQLVMKSCDSMAVSHQHAT